MGRFGDGDADESIILKERHEGYSEWTWVRMESSGGLL
jgi:hypothetical protein